MADKRVVQELVQRIQSGELGTGEAVQLIQSAMEAALRHQAEFLRRLYLSSMLGSKAGSG